MTRHNLLRIKLPRLALAMWLPIAASCTREEIDAASRKAHGAADKVDSALHTAKGEAHQLKDKLPVLDAVKDKLHEAADDVKHAVKTADAELSKTSAEAKAKIRQRVSAVGKSR